MQNTNKIKSCLYCNDKTHKGFKLECDYKDCDSTFHVTCAVNEQIIIACDKMVDSFRNPDNTDHIGVFCLDHLHMGKDLMNSTEKLARIEGLKKRKYKNPFK